MIEQTYRIDMIPNGAPVVVHVSQYDTAARRLSFELYNGEVAYELPAGAVASIAGTKPDNTSFLYAMTVSGNLVSIDLQQQMALVAGDVPAEIQITGAEGKIGSANFIIRVERGPIDENSVISETDLPIFEHLVSDAQTASSEAQAAAKDAVDAAASVGDIVPASAGTPGQVLTKTEDGADWEDVGGSWGSIAGTLSDQTDLQNALNAKANASNLATIESSTTASQAYAVGDYLVYNGILYKVISAIDSGETLTPNTNIEATTEGAELTSLNKGLSTTNGNLSSLTNTVWEWETFEGTVAGVAQTFYRKRLGNVYIIFGAGIVNVAIGAGTTSSRPIVYANKPFNAVYGGAVNLAASGQIDSHARYVMVDRDRVDAWLYNPPTATVSSMTYTFIIIGIAAN